MHPQKAVKPCTTRTFPLPMVDRSHAEEHLFERWAAADCRRIIDDLDLDDPFDQQLSIELTGIRHSRDRFNA